MPTTPVYIEVVKLVPPIKYSAFCKAFFIGTMVCGIFPSNEQITIFLRNVNNCDVQEVLKPFFPGLVWSWRKKRQKREIFLQPFCSWD